MSQENVDLVRQIFDGWGRGDLRTGVPHYDSDIVLVLREEFPEAGTYRGTDEIRKYTRQMLAPWDDFAISGEEFVDAGDRVLVRVRQHGTGLGSGAPGELRYFQVWTFRERSVIRIESIWDRDEALEAAGLRE
jgi:uncharacterized protein